MRSYSSSSGEISATEPVSSPTEQRLPPERTPQVVDHCIPYTETVTTEDVLSFTWFFAANPVNSNEAPCATPTYRTGMAIDMITQCKQEFDSSRLWASVKVNDSDFNEWVNKLRYHPEDGRRHCTTENSNRWHRGVNAWLPIEQMQDYMAADSPRGDA